MVSRGLLWLPLETLPDKRGLPWCPVVAQRHFPERCCAGTCLLPRGLLWVPLEARGRQPVTFPFGLTKARTPSAKRCLGNKCSEAVKQGSEKGGSVRREQAKRVNEASQQSQYANSAEPGHVVSHGLDWLPLETLPDNRGLPWSPVVAQHHFPERCCARMSLLSLGLLWVPLEARGRRPVTFPFSLVKARTPSAKRCLGIFFTIVAASRPS